MNAEFHYYVTYLLAVKAGFASSDAYKIAYSSQYVDDNHKEINIYNSDEELIYKNVLTQNYNVLRPAEELNNIYPVYHFVPDETLSKKSKRKDGCLHILDTHPDNKNVNYALHAALKSGDPYWIGIASHAFVDSWAHQNFTGTLDCYNAMPGSLRSMIMDLGHADMMAEPDHIGHIWKDKRLLKEMINNNERFLIAAMRLFEEYLVFLKEKEGLKNKLIKEIKKHIKFAFGRATKNLFWNLCASHAKRMKSYHRLSVLYSKLDIHQYIKDEWINEALKKLKIGNIYKWHDKILYKTSHWYLFQNAAKKHHEFVWPLIKNKLDC